MAERQNIEWKSVWKDEYLAWICGFANAQGGKLYIGVDNDGTVAGVENWRKLMEDLPNKIRDAMGIIVSVNLLEDGKLKYLEIDVPPYPVAISCKGSYYYRSGSTNQKLTGPELESFILRRRGVNWESSPLPRFSLEDVADSTVKLFREKAVQKGRLDEGILQETKAGLLEKLYLKQGDHLTNAAALLFSSAPERWFLGAYIKIGYFENDADLIYQDEVRGSLLEQVDKTLDLIYFKYLKAKISYQGPQRIERYPYPEAALREALLNAIVHKDYSSGIPIQISVYEDKLYIANVGKLPETWTLENLMEKHVSKPYNPNIAHAFYLTGFIESWGRGIEKMFRACREDGVPEPEYTIHPGDIMIKFTAPEDRIIRSHADGVTDKVTDGVTDKVTDKVTENERQLLDLLLLDPGYTSDALAQHLSISRKTVSKRLKSLKEKGVLRRVGSDRKGHWEIIE